MEGCGVFWDLFVVGEEELREEGEGGGGGDKGGGKGDSGEVGGSLFCSESGSWEGVWTGGSHDVFI